MAGKKSKKSKKNKEHKPAGGSSAKDIDESRRLLRNAVLKMMEDVIETYGDLELRNHALRECAATIEAYAEYVKATTGDQYRFNLQSKYYSSETVEVAFADESTVAVESGDLKTFANLFEEFLDKLHQMAGLLPVSKTGKEAKALEKERTTLIKSDSDAKGRATGEKDLVGLEEQLMKMRYQSLHQNNRYISSAYQYKY